MSDIDGFTAIGPVPVQPCGATRAPLQDYGWQCYGAGLVVIMTMKIDGEALPIVLPSRALEVVEPESWWDDPIVPFTGGDHLHLWVPRRPLRIAMRSTGVMLWGGGGTAMPVICSGSFEALMSEATS